jgi:hypothetical protein
MCEDEEEGGSDTAYNERSKHVELAKHGAKCYLIMCQADDVDAIPRTIKDFDNETIFPGGKVVQLDNDWFIELLARVPIRTVMRKSK